MEVAEAKFDLQTSLTKRLKYVTEVKQELWKKWMAQVFQGQLLAKKWRKTHRDIQVDLVLVKRDSMNGERKSRTSTFKNNAYSDN